MDVKAKDLLTALAMVQRVMEDLNARAAHITKLIDLLMEKGVLTSADKRSLDGVLKEQMEIAKKIDIAENEPEMPTVDPLPEELGQELKSLGVISEAKTLADTLNSDFHELLERALQEYRREQRHGPGEAGTVADV